MSRIKYCEFKMYRVKYKKIKGCRDKNTILISNFLSKL